MARSRAPYIELMLRAMQGGSKNVMRPGLECASVWLRALFSRAPDVEGEAFITETGRVGRITSSRMCGDTRGMTLCYDIVWSTE